MSALSSFQKHVIAVGLVLAGLSMLGLWAFKSYTWSRQIALHTSQSADEAQKGSVLASTTTVETTKTPEQLLEERVAKLEKRVAALEKKTGTTGTSATKSVLKEQTVYLGSGSSNNTNWTDIESAAVELNAGNYPGIKHVFFEATLSIVGGEASARLKNKTTGGVIYLSEVTHNSSTPTVKLSAPFWLSGGSNEYIVQIRSSSNEKVVLDGARLRLQYE